MTDALTLHVAIDGDDDVSGTSERPLRTLHGARDRLRSVRHEDTGPVTVLVHEGTHELGETLIFTRDDSGTADAPITYRAATDAVVTLSGGRRLDCDWQPYRDGIMVCDLSEAASGRPRLQSALRQRSPPDAGALPQSG